MRLARFLRLAASLSALAVSAAGCGGACQQLAERICKCQPEGSIRNNCNVQAQNQLKQTPKPGQSDEDFCDARLGTCADPGKDPAMCDRLNGEQGKVDCGVAYPP